MAICISSNSSKQGILTDINIIDGRVNVSLKDIAIEDVAKFLNGSEMCYMENETKYALVLHKQKLIYTVSGEHTYVKIKLSESAKNNLVNHLQIMSSNY